jgi:Fur family ferric uptake transcriptional regulator
MQKGRLVRQFATVMHRYRLKVTPARLEVFSVLAQAGQPLLPREIIERSKGANTSSVYRTLPLFAKHKIARKVSKGFKTLYELGDNFTNHQHYVVCERCGKTVAITSQHLERLANEITVLAGMKPAGHFIELLGICKQCQYRVDTPKNGHKHHI